jgi:hypothetical protein
VVFGRSHAEFNQIKGKAERVTQEKSKEASRAGTRPIGVFVLSIAVALTGILALGPAAAQAKFKQPGCAKFKKKMKKTKGKAGKQRLKYRFKQCKADRKVYNQVKDSRFVGFREDGEPVDIILCANGKFADDLDSQYGQVYTKGWRITDAKVRGKNFTAVYEALEGTAKVGNTEQIQIFTRAGSLARKNGQWQSGTSDLGLLGDVTRTSAKKECRKL